MRIAILSIILISVAVLSGAVLGGDDYYDHMQIRQLVEEGKLIPLEEILQKVGSGERVNILEVEIEREDGRYIYEIEMLGKDGRVWEMEIDAVTGETVEYHLED
ncbi:MAG: PepSY domain-containing protein [Sedimenticola sp.]